ncbi:MAG: glycosyltransferase [Gammaproteobacteria bacterium]|nr:glycosyltransferase [Gammaproteobacteria bacterium]
MTKIVHFGKYYPPDMGGTEIITQSLALAASEKGDDVTVVCFDQSGTGDGIDNKVHIQRYPIQRMLNSQPLSFSYFLAAVREGRNADILHLHAPNLLAALASLLIGNKPKLVVHWHTDIVGKGWLGQLVAPLEHLMLKKATTIIATSQRYAESSKPLQPFLEKVRIVPLGVTPPKLNQMKTTLPSRLDEFVAGRKLILSVGRLTAYKGFSVLIESAKYLPDNVAIIIAGGGELASDLARLIKSKSLENKLLLAGRVSQEELTALYLNAELFCLPSIFRSEAFGVVQLEAMAYGLPIVATNIEGSGVPWVNEHNVSGINVVPNNAAELAAACEYIINNPELRHKLSQNALERYKSNFTEELFIQNSLAIYKEIL